MKKKTMEKLKFVPIIILVMMISIPFLIFYIDWLGIIDESKNNLTFEKCCNGTYCTDTYYTPEDNLCHLVLCENLYGKNHPKCIYKGEK